MASGPPASSQPATIDAMPTVYTQHQVVQDDVYDREFLTGVSGILKAIEAVFSLVTFICASVAYAHKDAAGWIQFVSMTAFIIVIILYVFHAFMLPPKLSKRLPFKFSELCFYGVFAVFYFISGVVAAVFGSVPALAAAAFFSFASLILFVVDAYFCYTAWRRSDEGPYFDAFGGSQSAATTSNEPGFAPPGSYNTGDRGPQY